jgi:hypothetical protein
MPQRINRIYGAARLLGIKPELQRLSATRLGTQ